MKLNSFKELLLKKSEDNKNLQILIKYMRDDYLVGHVIESLEKMAASYSKKNPNHAIMHFGTNIDKGTEGDMFHDALSHHASNYKSALNAGNTRVADQHMAQIFKMMHMADKLTKDGYNDHSGGKLKIEAIDPKPWERSYFKDKKDNGKFKTDTKGWGRGPTKEGYSFLRGAPHESYKGEIATHGHNKAYPLNEIKVNGKYLHIDDSNDKTNNAYEPHPFDSHPIMSHYKRSPKAHDSISHDKYLKEYDDFHADGGGMDKYFDLIESRDPVEHEARGSKKSDPVHKDIEGLDLSDTTKRDIENAKIEGFEKPISDSIETKQEKKLSEKPPTLEEVKAKIAAIRNSKKPNSIRREDKSAKKSPTLEEVKAKLAAIRGKK